MKFFRRRRRSEVKNEERALGEQRLPSEEERGFGSNWRPVSEMGGFHRPKDDAQPDRGEGSR